MMAKIVVNPEILDGKPIIEGTRLSVEHVLGLLASGMSKVRDYRGLPGVERRKHPSGAGVCFGAHVSSVGTPQWSGNRSPNHP